MAEPGSKGPDRFAPIRSSVITSAVGQPVHGLPDRLTKRVNQHAFEASKALSNLEIADQSSAKPGGKRFAGQVEFNERIEQIREDYDDWKKPNHLIRETLTSAGNLLRTSANDPEGRSAEELEAEAEMQEGAKSPEGKRCFRPNQHYGTCLHLGPGMVPISTAQLTANHAAATGGHGNQEQDDEREEAMDAACQVTVAGGTVRCPGAALPAKDEEAASGKRRVAMQQVSEDMLELKKLEAELIRQYPHGVPKQVLLKLRQERGLAAAALPTLGFGSKASLSDKLVATLPHN